MSMLASFIRNNKNSLQSPSSADRGVREESEASSHQRNVGMLPRFPSRSLSHFSESDLGNAWIGEEAPELPLCFRLPPFSLAFFSASQTGERPRYKASPSPSQLSCHWLHTRNNETSSETRLQKTNGGGSI